MRNPNKFLTASAESSSTLREFNPATARFRISIARSGKQRRGAALVFGLILSVSLVTLLGIVLDFGYIHVGRTEMRRSADAAAMSACWEMLDQQVAGTVDYELEAEVKSEANKAALANIVGDISPELKSSDIELGTYNFDGTWSTSDHLARNAVRVTLRRQSCNNGELPLFFGALTGRNTQSLEVTATAAMMQAIDGFYEPSNYDETLELLPFALDLPSWQQAIANATLDQYAFKDGSVISGSDGFFETNLYPKGTGSPGNRGTVDIGGRNNSTADLSRQILHGVSKQDFIDLGKPLMLDANGELLLNGDTGISAGVKDELASIIGKPRIIPIYTSVAGNGNNAMFTIVAFEGVRILNVKLTGKKDKKEVVIQPAKVIARGCKVDTTGSIYSTHLVTPVMLVE
ncbi:hypothetical protein CA13_63160 [Planctomycetes bacterium CA13]|uniref:Flp pilus-assembly TadG-like N-terminal domain-containing protein n=1 Tax=Novipirellula herctigrandis TaxID=2527986 RepID=A0A5C5ZCF9_9BACT|nr:hypothetical protein CA13_63160 [Planctomycetes bacterium CA13]